MLISFAQLFLLFLAGSLLLPTPRRRGLAIVGTIAAGLAFAAFAVTLRSAQPDDLALQVARVGVPTSFLQLNSGILLLGMGLVLVAASREWRVPAGERIQALVAILVLVAAVILGGRALFSLGRYVGWLPIVGSALGIGAAGWGASVLARLGRFLEPWRRLDQVLLERRPPPMAPVVASTADLVWFGGVVISAAAIALAPSLRAVALATVVLAVTGHVQLRRSGAASPVPVAPLFALLMIPVFGWLRTTGGMDNPSMADLASGPFSAAAQNQIAPYVWLIGFGLAALWPLHGLVYPLSAPIAAILMLRIGAAVLPDGFEHWAPLFMPVILLGLWHTAATLNDPAVHGRRVMGLLTGAALFGVVAGGAGLTGAWWLVAAGLICPWLGMVGSARPWIPRAWTRLVWVAPGYGGYLVVEGGLARQVTWTVLFAIATAVAGWRATTRLY